MTISGETIQALLAFVVSGGLAALVTQFIRGLISLKTGARANTREVIKDIAAARDESEEREAMIRMDKDYWRGVAGDYAWQLRANGIHPDPPEPRSPSEQRREQTGTARWRRAQRAPSTDEINRVIDGDLPEGR